ncbi:MAG: cation:dicarboxylate symporter family transporter [Holosporales bacterium]
MTQTMTKLFKSLPFQLAVVLAGTLLFGDLVPTSLQSLAFALSLAIKETLVFFLPFIVFTFLVSGLLAFHKAALKFILMVLGAVIVSNFLCTIVLFPLTFTDFFCLSCLNSGEGSTAAGLQPLFTFKLPSLIANEVALMIGALTGLIFAFFPSPSVSQGIHRLKAMINFGLSKLFIPLLPVFIFGFVLKLKSDGALGKIFMTYSPVFALMALIMMVYIVLFYGLGAGFKPNTWMRHLKNMGPATLTAFSTMSSAATMPLTLKGAETNTTKPELIQALIPATVNIHLVGDGIGIPVLMMVILGSFGMPMPSFETFFQFTALFVMYKFAMATVPGGGILVMVPTLERVFGFTPEMVGLITALYIVFDPLITVTNVNGNGAFATVFARLFGKRMA